MTPEWTIDRIYQSVPESDLQELEESGTAADNIHWLWGRKAAEWIRRGLPSMWVYAAVAKKVGRSSVTIRQCYYTFKAFQDIEFDERVPYSVYNHARQWSDPDEVINYYMEQRCSVDEVETVFRISETEDEREQFAQTNLPRFLVGAWREMYGLPKEKYDNALNYLNLFLQEIGWNK